MSMDNYSLSDIASITKGEDGFGGNMGFFWIFALLLLAGGGFGGFNNNRYADSALNTFATASSQNEILLGQKFDALSRQINQVGDGLCSSTYALNNSINSAQNVIGTAINGVSSQVANCCCETQRAIDGVNYNGAINTASINANTTAQMQKILDKMSEDKIASLEQQINQLQLQNAMASVVKYPTSSAYCSGANPFCSCGCNCNY